MVALERGREGCLLPEPVALERGPENLEIVEMGPPQQPLWLELSVAGFCAFAVCAAGATPWLLVGPKLNKVCP